jgi:excisionase family DNA binding protein
MACIYFPRRAPSRSGGQLLALIAPYYHASLYSGNLPFVKVGRRRLITRQHLQQFLGVAP